MMPSSSIYRRLHWSPLLLALLAEMEPPIYRRLHWSPLLLALLAEMEPLIRDRLEDHSSEA